MLGRQVIRLQSHTRGVATASVAKKTWGASPKRRVTAAAATAQAPSPAPVRAAAAAVPVQPPSSGAVGSSTSSAASPAASTPSDAEMHQDLDDGGDQPIPEVVSRRAAATSTSTSSTAPSALPQSTFPSTSSFPLSGVAAGSAISPNAMGNSAPEIDWSTSYHGLSSQPFSERQAATLMRPLEPSEIEIKPDGLLYLPEILYRRILNQAFGPGGWGMVPRGEMTVMKSMVTREWGLVAGGRLISIARGEQTYFDPSGLPTATEGCKSNALMRCCKDLGIASELWDPGFIRVFKAQHCVEAWTEHGSTKKKQKRWRKKGNKFEYPLKEASA